MIYFQIERVEIAIEILSNELSNISKTKIQTLLGLASCTATHKKSENESRF
jgi:hypothetical protein